MLGTFFGIVWTVVSLAVTFGGFPHQILVNYRQKKANMSPLLIVTAMTSYLAGSLYGMTKPDHLIALMQAPAFILVAIIGLQAIAYRRTK